MLTDVAAENPISHLRTQVFGDGILQFDGEVGNAAARVNCAVWQDALGGAGIDAAGACAAVVGGEGIVGFEANSKQNFSEKKCGASLRVDEHGVFADPTQACALSEFAFKDGSRVCVITVGNWMADLFFDELDELLQAGRDDVVIIVAEGVGCNPHPQPLSLWERGVGHCQYEDGFAFGKNLFWVCATDAAALFGEILHGAVLFFVEPRFKDVVMRWWLTRSNASQDESQLARFFFDGLFERCQITGR